MQVGVAVMDTGIFRHRDFENRIIGFADFVNGRKYVYDDNGHGTHVAGIIAGDGRSSQGKYRGIAPKAALIGVKVLDNAGNGKIKNVIRGTDWIIKNKDYYNIRVVNISFGTRASVKQQVSVSPEDETEEEELVEAVERMWDSGLIVVAAAGNNGPGNGSVTAPGISKKIITVGAFDDRKYFSGRGPTTECVIKPEVVVTGTNIIACSNRQGRYSSKSGTSMAAPIVSGAVAGMLGHNPYVTPKEVKIWMKSCCKKINIPYNQQGWGMLDIAKFVAG